MLLSKYMIIILKKVFSSKSFDKESDKILKLSEKANYDNLVVHFKDKIIYKINFHNFTDAIDF